MAEEGHYNRENKVEECDSKMDHGPGGVEHTTAATTTTDRGLFDFLGKKDAEKKPTQEEEVMTTEFEKVKVSESEPKVEECKKEEKKHTSLREKLHRSDSSSSSSSDEEEVEEGGVKIKKKKEKKNKGLKEKIEEKISGDHKEEGKKYEDTSVPVEKCEEPVVVTESHEPTTEEKKGFLDKIKDKLPGHKKTEEVVVVAPPPPTPAAPVECTTVEDEPKEKKGLLEKIKEKLPGYHTKPEEEKEKEKEKESSQY